MKLDAALALRPREVISFAGAGGKTSAMFRLARELAGQGHAVVATTTTAIFAPEPGQADAVVVCSEPGELVSRVLAEIAGGRVLVCAAGHLFGGKLKGVDPSVVDRLSALPGLPYLLVEADGAARKPLKAPAEHEPVLPTSTTVLVPVVGAGVLGRRLAEENVHRPERVAALTGLSIGGVVRAVDVARVVLGIDGGLKGPGKGRVFPLVNQADSPEGYLAAMEIAREMCRAARRFRPGCPVDGILIGQVARADPVIHVIRPGSADNSGPNVPWVTAAVLAAGASRRFGTPKQLFPIDGRPMLARVLSCLVSSEVDEVIVVLGHAWERVLPIVREAWQDSRPPVWPVLNPDPDRGMSSSIGRAVGAADPEAAGLLVALGDLPFIGAEVVNSLVREFRAKSPAVTLATTGGRAGHPVVFRRDLFPELETLSGDRGARAVVDRHRHEILAVETGTEAILRDIDTREDLEESPCEDPEKSH